MPRFDTKDVATSLALVHYWNSSFLDEVSDLGRFAVVYSLPGCLPDAEPTFFDQRDEAEQYVRDLRLEGEDIYGRNDPYVYEVLDLNEA